MQTHEVVVGDRLHLLDLLSPQSRAAARSEEVADADADRSEEDDERERGEPAVEVGVGAVRVRADHIAGCDGQVADRVARQVVLRDARDVTLAPVVDVGLRRLDICKNTRKS